MNTTHRPVTAVAEHGYAIIPRVFEPGEMRELALELENSKLPRSKAGIRHAMGTPSVSKVASDPRLLELARKVLGERAVPYRATLFDKSTSANWLVVWHQDTALPLKNKLNAPGWGPWSVKQGVNYAHAPAAALSSVLALRIHLDDSSAQNGVLRAVPGSHRLGVLSDDEIRSIAASNAPVDCCVGQGGVLAMRPLLVHASSKSRNSAQRRVLHIEYAASLAIAPGLELSVA